MRWLPVVTGGPRDQHLMAHPLRCRAGRAELRRGGHHCDGTGPKLRTSGAGEVLMPARSAGGHRVRPRGRQTSPLPGTGRLVRTEPRSLTGPRGAGRQLAELTGICPGRCPSAVLHRLRDTGAARRRDADPSPGPGGSAPVASPIAENSSRRCGDAARPAAEMQGPRSRAEAGAVTPVNPHGAASTLPKPLGFARTGEIRMLVK
jgi:hypothetical protein